MKHLDLFSGIGGFALAARWAGIETVGFCEIEEFPRKVLQKNFPCVPIHYDFRELDGSEYERIGKQARPAWAGCEIVTDLDSMGLDGVLADLESEGYSTRPLIIPAGAVQRDHARERLWVVAHNERAGAKLEEHTDSRQERSSSTESQRALVSQRYRESCSKGIESSRMFFDEETFSVAGQSEPIFMGSAHGIPDRMDRRKGLGNAIVPQVAYEIFVAISGMANS